MKIIQILFFKDDGNVDGKKSKINESLFVNGRFLQKGKIKIKGNQR